MPESQYSITASISVGEQNASFVTWTSATAVNSTATLVNNDISYNTLNISLNQTTTITGGVVTFQGSFDGVNFFNMQGFNPATQQPIGSTYTLIASTYAVFQFNLTAIPYFQVLLSTAITGTGSVTIGYSADSFVSALTTTAVTGTVAVTQSTSPWVVSLTSTTITGTVAVTQSTSPWVVDGNLTNNNAAPTATLQGILPAIAETAYATVTYTTGNFVLPVTDLHGALNQDLQAWSGTALGTPTNFGTTPGAVIAGSVNASLFAGTTSIPALTNNNAAPTASLVGVLPALAETAYTTVTYTTGDMVLPVTDLHGALNQDLQAVAGVALTAAVSAYGTAPTGTAVMGVNAFVTNVVTVVGNKTNNNAAPGATNIGALVAIVAPTNTTFPTYTAGDEVLLVTDLAGNTNTDMQYWAGSDLGAPSNYGTSPGAVTVPGVNAYLTQFPVSAASADALANPTITQVGVENMLFNGTTWDRQRNNINTTTGDTGAHTASFNGATQTNYNARGAYITILLGTVSGGALTFSAQFQWSPDGGTTWFSIGNALTGNMINTGTSGVYVIYPTNISQSVGNGPQNIDPTTTAVAAVNIPMPRTWRLAYTIGGTTPSYTFTGVYVNYIL
jgi:hypothetical protein